MGGIIVIIVIILLIMRADNNAKKQKQMQALQQERQQQTAYQQPVRQQQTAYTQPVRQQQTVYQQPVRQQPYERTPKAVPPAMKRSAEPDIVKKAKKNVNRFAGEDVTLVQLQTEHQHSEKVATAKAAYVEKEEALHRQYHENPDEFLQNENLLGSVEDLMVKGYDGNLSFERDFLGEGLDMINRFVV